MKGNVKKKILIIGFITLLQLILFSLTLTSNAETQVTVVGTWDVSADDGTSHVTATLYSDGKMIISGTGKMKSYSSSGDLPYNDRSDRIKTVEIQQGVTNIGSNAFYKCNSLIAITIPNSITSIESFAFHDCTNITSIEIPSSITSIEEHAFLGCSSLTNINVDRNNQDYSSENGVLFNKDKTELIKYPEGKKDTTYTIPNSVISIRDWSFSICRNLISIKIPSSVTNIGDYVFSECSSLTSIEIPNGIASIGDYTFYGCSSLTKIEIPNSITNIGIEAFANCGNLTSINVDINNQKYSSENGILFNKEKTELVKYPEGKNDIEYTISSSVTSIGEYAFSRCSSLTNMVIPDGVTKIKEGSFYGCNSLTSVEIADSVTSIGYSVFKGCSSLTNIVIPDGVTKIEESSFYACSSLTNIEIPNSVTSIESSAFANCSSLTSIEIPDSVTSIGEDVFSGAKLTVAVATGTENIQELELPDIIKRTMNEEDILYTENEFTLTNCSLSEDKTKLIVDTEVASTSTVSLKVTQGALNGLTVVVVPSGTITYSTTSWTKDAVTAILHIASGEMIKSSGAIIYEEGDGYHQLIEVANKKYKDYKQYEGSYAEDLYWDGTIASDGCGIVSCTIVLSGYGIDVTPRDVCEKMKSEVANYSNSENLSKLLNLYGLSNERKTYSDYSSILSDIRNNLQAGRPVIVGINGTSDGTYSSGGHWMVILGEDNGHIITANPGRNSTPTDDTLENFISTQMSSGCGYILITQDYNEGKNAHTFTKNGTFTFKYLTKEGEEKEAVATVNNIEELTIKTYEETEENGSKYIEGIKPGESVQEVLNNIETNGTLEVYKESSKITDANTKVATGMTIKIKWGTIDEETYTLVVTGDLNGDGEMGDTDLLRLVRYNAGIDTSLNGTYLRATDIYKDKNYADSKDLLKLARVLAELENL